MAFPFPVIRRNPDASEVFLSQDQVEAQAANEERRHQENLAQQRLAEKEAEKRAEEEKKRNAEALKEQKKLFNDTLRTGLLGKLDFAFRNRDKLFDNFTDMVTDSLKDRFFGKTIGDKEKDEDSDLRRTTVIERILTSEKYIERARDIEPEEPETPEPLDTTPETPKVPEDNSDDSDDKENDKAPFTNNVIEFPKAFTVEKDISAEKKQIPILDKINKSLGGISKTLTKFFKDSERREKDRLKKENSNRIMDEFDKNESFIPEIKVDKKGFGLPIVMGISGLMTAISGAVMGALGFVGRSIVAAAPIAAFAGGLYLSVKDGIAGWFSADAWGVGKLSGMIGGLLGGLDEGAWGAIKNGGKWALLGAGIGSVVPVVGTLFGGLIGAAIGALLGFVGGEKIAKFNQGIVDFMTQKWEDLKAKFWSIVSWFDDVKSIFTDGVKALTDIDFTEIKKAFEESVHNLYDKAKEFVKNLFSYDYWFGDTPPEEAANNIKKMSATDANGEEKQVEVQKPTMSSAFDTEAEEKKKISNLESYLDKMVSDQIDQRNEAIERIYDQQVDNSVTNTNTSTDYSRTNNTAITNNSNNNTKLSIHGTPNSRNREGTAFGTQSLINGGNGSFNRY